MKNNIDSKILKVMNLAIKYIGKLTEEDLDKLIKGDSTFLVTDKHKNRRRRRREYAERLFAGNGYLLGERR